MRARCSGCMRPLSVCLCSHLVSLENRVFIHVLQHRKESKHALGTVWIAQKMLSQIAVHLFSAQTNTEKWLNKAGLGLLFPSPEAQPLHSFPVDNGSLLILLGTLRHWALQ